MRIHAATPYLIVDGAADAIDWYARAFGAVEVTRSTGGAGRIAHAELRIGSSSVFLADEHPHYESIIGPAKVGGTPVYLDLETDDVAGVFATAVDAGATAIREPTDPSLPVQSAKVRDPFGHVWLITQTQAP
ncbi:MAG: VOC family protein [Candidatus Limnocylindria bacterium]